MAAVAGGAAVAVAGAAVAGVGKANHQAGKLPALKLKDKMSLRDSHLFKVCRTNSD